MRRALEKHQKSLRGKSCNAPWFVPVAKRLKLETGHKRNAFSRWLKLSLRCLNADTLPREPKNRIPLPPYLQHGQFDHIADLATEMHTGGMPTSGSGKGKPASYKRAPNEDGSRQSSLGPDTLTAGTSSASVAETTGRVLGGSESNAESLAGLTSEESSASTDAETDIRHSESGGR